MDRLGNLTDSIQRPAPRANADAVIEIDALGFTHFQGTSTGSRRDADPVVDGLASFWLDLVDAGIRDVLGEVWKG